MDEVKYDDGIAIPSADSRTHDPYRYTKGRKGKPKLVTSEELMARKAVKQDPSQRIIVPPSKKRDPSEYRDFNGLEGGLPPEPDVEGPNPEFRGNLHAAAPATPITTPTPYNTVKPVPGMLYSVHSVPQLEIPVPSRAKPLEAVVLGLQDGDMHLMASAVLTCRMGVTVLVPQAAGTPYFVPRPGTEVKITWNDRTMPCFFPGVTFTLDQQLGLVFVFAEEPKDV